MKGMANMADNDYWVVVYKLLNYYYQKMKKGEPVDENEINAQTLKISVPYLLDVYRNMFDDGYLTGSKVDMEFTGQYAVADISSVRITSKGIEYLEDNSKMKQIYKILKEVKEWLPGM